MKFNRHNLLVIAIGLEMLLWAFMVFIYIKKTVQTHGFSEEIIYVILWGSLGACSLIVQSRHTQLVKPVIKKDNLEGLLDSEILGTDEIRIEKVPFLLRAGNAIYGFINILFAIILIGLSIYRIFDDTEPFSMLDIVSFCLTLICSFVGPMILYNMTSTNYNYR